MSQQSVAGIIPKRFSFARITQKKASAIINTISALLILLFMYASVSKLASFQWFYGEMNSQPFPNWMTPYLAWGVPSIEILIALGLMFDKTKLISLYSSLGLMSLFTIYIGLILLNVFDKVPCSCGGVLKQLGWRDHLFFNLFFVFISIVATVLYRKKMMKNGR